MSKSNKTIQEKMADLSGLVAWFDSDDFAIEVAIDKFRVAEKLAEEIEHDLKHLKNDIEVVKQKFDQAS